MSGKSVTTYTMSWPDVELVYGDWFSVVRPEAEPRVRCAICGGGSSLKIQIDDCEMRIDCKTAADLEPIVRELQARIAMLSPGIGRER